MSAITTSWPGREPPTALAVAVAVVPWRSSGHWLERCLAFRQLPWQRSAGTAA